MPEGVAVSLERGELFRTLRDGTISLPRGLSFDAWVSAGRIIGDVERRIGWLTGEWWLYGPWTEERRLEIVSNPNWNGPTLSTCRNAATCCKKFPKSRRRELIPFTHHMEVVKLPDAEAEAMLDKMQVEAEETGKPPASRWVRTEVKRLKRATREVELADATRKASDDLGSKVFGVIYADPPWRFAPYSRETGMDRSADNHYPTMSTDEIGALPVPVADDAVLFLWATVPMLPEALAVLVQWGFTYRSHCIWNKPHAGTGYWFRNRHELLLVGTRGSIPAPAPGQQFCSVIEAPLGGHSDKPAAFAEMIEELFPNVPAVELFARGPRVGWDVWGNES